MNMATRLLFDNNVSCLYDCSVAEQHVLQMY